MTNTHILEGAFFALCATGATAFALLSVLLACEIIDRLRAWRRLGSRFACVALLLLSAAPAAAQAPTPMATLAAERANVGTPMSKSEIGQILNATARKHGLFLLSKPNGNNCPLPDTGELISCDWIVRPDGWGFDVLRDQEAAGEVVGPQGEPGEHFAAERLVAPRGASPELPPATPPSTIPANDLTPIRTWIDMTRMELYAQNERIFADLVARNNALAAQLEKHDKEPGFWQKALTNPTVLASIVGGVTTWLASR